MVFRPHIEEAFTTKIGLADNRAGKEDVYKPFLKPLAALLDVNRFP